MKKLFFLSLLLCLLFQSQAQKTDVPANSKSQSADKSTKKQASDEQADLKSQASNKPVKKQTQYTTVLPLNKSESQMLLTGILTYSITHPDSVQADLMSNLIDLQNFIDSGDTLSGYFKNVPVRAISYVEQKYFGKDGIMGYSPKDDNQQFESMERTITINVQQLEISKEQLRIAREATKNKISFQCKYYTANGYPCPADAPKVEVTPVKNDEN